MATYTNRYGTKYATDAAGRPVGDPLNQVGPMDPSQPGFQAHHPSYAAIGGLDWTFPPDGSEIGKDPNTGLWHIMTPDGKFHLYDSTAGIYYDLDAAGNRSNPTPVSQGLVSDKIIDDSIAANASNIGPPDLDYDPNGKIPTTDPSVLAGVDPNEAIPSQTATSAPSAVLTSVAGSAATAGFTEIGGFGVQPGQGQAGASITGVPQQSFLFGSGNAYDQGQVSTSLYYQNDLRGIPKTYRSEYGGIPMYGWRDRNFNPQNQLQVDQVSNEHTPSRPLTLHDAIPLGIKRKYQLQQPFRFKDFVLRDLDTGARMEALYSGGVITPKVDSRLFLLFKEYISFADGGSTDPVVIPPPYNTPVNDRDAQLLGGLPFIATYYQSSDYDFVTAASDGRPYDNIRSLIVEFYNKLRSLEQSQFSIVDAPIPLREMLSFHYHQDPVKGDPQLAILVKTLESRFSLPTPYSRTSAYFTAIFLPKLRLSTFKTKPALEALRAKMIPYYRSPRPSPKAQRARQPMPMPPPPQPFIPAPARQVAEFIGQPFPGEHKQDAVAPVPVVAAMIPGGPSPVEGGAVAVAAGQFGGDSATQLMVTILLGQDEGVPLTTEALNLMAAERASSVPAFADILANRANPSALSNADAVAAFQSIANQWTRGNTKIPNSAFTYAELSGAAGKMFPGVAIAGANPLNSDLGTKVEQLVSNTESGIQFEDPAENALIQAKLSHESGSNDPAVFLQPITNLLAGINPAPIQVSPPPNPMSPPLQQRTRGQTTNDPVEEEKQEGSVESRWDLQSKAKKLGIKGISSMNKSQLRDAIKAHAGPSK